MTQFLTAAGATGLVKSVVDLVKYIKARDTNGAVTTLAVWVAGILVAILLAASDIAKTIALSPTLSLDNANMATLILVGVGLGATAATVNDFKKAVDTSDSASKPPLVADKPVTPPTQ